MSKSKISNETLNKIQKDPKHFAESVSISELVKILKTLSSVYYNTGESLVDDQTFDILKDTLEERDPKNPFLNEVGAPVERLKVQLPYPMSSLSKIKPEKDTLTAWLKKYKGPYVVSDKLDGTSAQYYKESANNFKLYSRGDGIEGQDITHLIPFVIQKSVKTEAIPVGTSIRGEIIISKNDFKKISDIMKNARNASSGVVNSKTIDKNVAKLCQFVAYAVLHPNYKFEEQMKLLKQYGFKVADYTVEKNLTYEMLSNRLIDRRKNGEFEVDGLVVFDSSQVYQPTAENPDYGFAFKTIMQDQVAQTRVVKVEWNPSKNGYLKPTLEVEPVELGGTTVTHATAFNAKFIVDNKLGPDAIVKIVRSGDVIPYIMEIVKPAEEPQMPDVAYKWNDTHVDIILKDIYGAQADAVAIKLITFFFATLGVEYIGEGIVAKLVNTGYKTIPKIIDAFKNKKDKLTDIEGLGQKMIEKIWINMENALKHTNLATFMAASHVFGRGFGVRKLNEILNVYPDIMNSKWTQKEMIENIEKIKGFSSTTATQFAKNFNDFKKFYNEVNKIIDISYLEEVPEESESEEEQANLDLQGKAFVFTGFRDKDLEKQISDRGGRVASAVSSKTTAVIKPDGSEEKSGKIKDAEKDNVEILTKSEFVNKYLK